MILCVTMENKVLLEKIDLVIDDQKMILGGAIILEDKRILDVLAYPYDKRLKNYDGKRLELEGLIIMPNFKTLDHSKRKVLAKSELNQASITKYHNDGYIVGLDQSNLSYDVLDTLDFDYITNLKKYAQIDLNHLNLLNYVLLNKNKYLELSLDEVDIRMLPFIINNLGVKRIIIKDKQEEAMKQLSLLGYSLNDIVAMTSLNARRLLRIDHLEGTLRKGKVADLMIVKDNLDVVLKIQEGRVL